MNGNIFEVIVVGAGPAGLMCGYYLRHLGLEHMLFDQGRMGESWRSQRWDNFRMITPFQSSLLPGSLLKARKPEAYGTSADMVSLLQEYTASFQIPITEHARVLSIEKNAGQPVFQVKVLHDNELIRTYDAWQVILAVGARNRPHIPAIAESLPSSLVQLPVTQYRNPEQLKPGGVLVIGGGQSGLEAAYDLVRQGRSVWLSCRPRVQLPQYYRGKEIHQWLSESRPFDRGTGISENPVISYAVADDRTLDLKNLHAMGVRILGPLAGASGQQLSFSPWTQADVEKAGSESVVIFRRIDDHIESQKRKAKAEGNSYVDPEPPEIEVRGLSESAGDIVSEMVRIPKSLDLAQENISTVIWATGFETSFRDVQTPLAFDQLMTHQKGITALDGLYVVGASDFAGSDYVVSAKEEAAFVANHIYGILR